MSEICLSNAVIESILTGTLQAVSRDTELGEPCLEPEWLIKGLRKLVDDIANEPLPENLVELLRQFAQERY